MTSSLLIVALLGFAGVFVVLAVVALVSRGGAMGQRVQVRLQGVRQIKDYELGDALAEVEEKKKAVKNAQQDVMRKKAFSEIPVLQDRFSGRPWAEKMQARLLQAKLPLSLTSFMMVCAACGILGGCVTILWGMRFHLVLTPLASVIFTTLPFLYVRAAVTRRTKKFNQQFPDALDLLSSSVKSGQALNSAIQNVAEEMPEPVGDEFRTLSDELSFGAEINDALRRFSERVDSQDVQFFCTALMIQKETGGNLSEVLDGLQKTIRERFRTLRHVKTLTAQGRLSGWILGAMPFVLGAIIGFSNWDYMSLLFMTPEGRKLLIVALVLQALGVFLVVKIVKIKV